MSIRTLLFFVGLLLALTRCAKQTDTLVTASISDYFPLQVGKYSIYQLDSSIYTSFGQTKEIRRHIIKDVVDAAITDNLGRPSFRIKRFMRSTADTTQWIDHATYMATPLDYSLEIIENNMRFIKLQLPIADYFSWNGNRYLPDDIFPEYGFNSTSHSHIGGWEYNYENINSTMNINGHIYDSTVTVLSAATDSTGFPPVSLNGPAFKTVWEEKYAKGVGLVSKIISLEEFQPISTAHPRGYYSGFALKQTLISHN